MYMTSGCSCTLTCPAQAPGATDVNVVRLIVQMSLSTLRVLRFGLAVLKGMFMLKIILLKDLS